MLCPKCNGAMEAKNIEDTEVEIDYCPQCQGTWLEKSEFSNIIDALNKES